jgi:hypothetical protein
VKGLKVGLLVQGTIVKGLDEPAEFVGVFQTKYLEAKFGHDSSLVLDFLQVQ